MPLTLLQNHYRFNLLETLYVMFSTDVVIMNRSLSLLVALKTFFKLEYFKFIGEKSILLQFITYLHSTSVNVVYNMTMNDTNCSS